MAKKKLPKGWSIKTEPVEVGLIDMYHWVIYVYDKELDRSFIKFDDRIDARKEGEKRLWEIHAYQDQVANEIIDEILAED